MNRFLICLMMCLVAVTNSARADDAPRPPDGCRKVAAVGKIAIFSTKAGFPGKAAEADLKEQLQGIWSYYSKQYGLEKEIVRIGPKGGIFGELKRDSVALVVFPTVEEYEAWVKLAGTLGITFHVGTYFNVVGIPMVDGKLSEEFLGVLWHELSHVFFSHYLNLGGPEWLNEGLAEYFHMKSKGKQSPAPKTRQDALDRLSKGRDDKTTTPAKDLLLMHGDKFGRQQYDEAWVLSHLLMTEASEQLNSMMSVLVDLERSAWANPDGVRDDIERLTADLITSFFGGSANLQAAWDEHLAALLKNPEDPPKLKTAPRKPKIEGITPIIDVRLGGTAPRPIDDKGTTMLMCRPRGTVIYRAPWEATELEVLFAVGDGEGQRWSDNFVFVQKTTAKAGKRFELIEAYIPHYKDSKKALATVCWKVKGGGEYRTFEVWDYR